MPFFEDALSGGGAGGVTIAPRVKRFVVGVAVEGGELDFHEPVNVGLQGRGHL
jgi:hypothetical protein